MTELCKIQLKKFKDSITRLEEVLRRNVHEDDIILDAAVQRFEFTFENGWKAVKQVLRFKGDECISPRDCIKKAYKYGWITEEESFLELLECRNLTSHTYNMNVAMKVYNNIKKNNYLFRKLYDKLEEIIQS
jgi:nucleotidyltransferase substrate binding protein (TIGR01987 family)